MSAPESRPGVSESTNTPETVSAASVDAGPLNDTIPARLTRCRYDEDPHPLAGECIDDLDEATLAGLRRVLAAVDGLPPEVDARPVRSDDGMSCCAEGCDCGKTPVEQGEGGTR